MNYTWTTTELFEKNIIALDAGDNLIIHQGGARSGKTIANLQTALVYAEINKGSICSVASRTLPHLKLGAMRDFDNILMSIGIIPDRIKNKTDNYYRIGESIIEFFGTDQLDKVHGPARDFLFINECNFLKYEIYEQLALRTSGPILLDYNPVARFWCNDNIMPNEKHLFIKSTYKNNQFCPKQIRERLDHKEAQYYRNLELGIENKALENWVKVYVLGEVGQLEGAIFTNWRFELDGETDGMFSSGFGFGLDYGFHPDPDAMAKIHIDKRRRKIYVKECIYETNNGTSDLIELINKHAKKSDMIIAESASPRTNYDLQTHFNITAVRKNKTVGEWLRSMQDYEIIISKDSYNLEKELSNYMWSDKKAGVPVDSFNHLIDTIRYFYMMTIGYEEFAEVKVF